jgi:hypothetical protein
MLYVFKAVFVDDLGNIKRHNSSQFLADSISIYFTYSHEDIMNVICSKYQKWRPADLLFVSKKNATRIRA